MPEKNAIDEYIEAQPEAVHIHIVYCHPSENSLTAEIRDAFLRGLAESGKICTISDLYKMGFKTDMSEQEYLRDAFYNAEQPPAPNIK